ncbi:tyrosine--tRNA ligase [Synechococcus sp. PCC 6312]|uniref:tyrosine--tRNA ligase n=1 Tax=Synechococcus sp. (strain ATCC 27167 / PCC 6312) TaxID=195253 RepID=UPI00029ECB9A|nr:tyrosine--tRNA ligase [Synechococcus sp. PCC 6312]AFY62118.1 tyrosyl-tRNA synthetase [Synechococcus sp. PCC 6312]
MLNLARPDVLSRLQRGVSEVFPHNPDSQKSAENLWQWIQEINRPLRVKLGIDPTGAEVHLGHSIVLRKLRAFQDAGHTAVLIMGNFTAQIGDPTGKSEVRPQLSAGQVAANVASYLDQVRPILDFATPGRLEICYNATWLESLNLSKIGQLLATMTVGQMLAKEGFAERYHQGQPVYLHEFLYPLMQGYDSVAIQSDLELGGTDQKFNIAVGRDLQRHFHLPPQFGLLMPILPGTDGVQKMSKSLGNYVGLGEDAVSMYSKLEKVPDAVIDQYFELLTNLPLEQLPNDPRQKQKLLAKEIVTQYHGAEIANQTQAELEAIVLSGVSQNRELIPEFSLGAISLPAKFFYILGLIPICGSSSEARRQIQGGGVRLDGEKITNVDWQIQAIEDLLGKVVQVGKKKFIRFTP